MSDQELRDRLGFTPAWYALGVVDDDWVDAAVRNSRQDYDPYGVHYRYGAYVSYLRWRRNALLAGECRALFKLAINDPDSEMGCSMILDLLGAPGCPDDVPDAAARHAPSARYVSADWRRERAAVIPDTKRVRQKLREMGPEAYYREFGYREDGTPCKDQTVYKVMRDLFDIDFKRFHQIKAAAVGRK
jgi:hypothetical protein